MSWSDEDERRLKLLEDSSPVGAMAAFHIRVSIAQAREQHRRAKADLAAFRKRRQQDDLDLWCRFGWLPDPDVAFLRSISIAPC